MPLAPDQLYDVDFFAWTQFQARELQRLARTYPNPALDLPHLAEEVRDIGREQKARFRGWTVQIMVNLILLERPPSEERRRAAVRAILDSRMEISLRETPALLRDLKRQLPRLYGQARRSGALWLEKEAPELPASCPYTLDQVLGEWWP